MWFSFERSYQTEEKWLCGGFIIIIVIESAGQIFERVLVLSSSVRLLLQTLLFLHSDSSLKIVVRRRCTCSVLAQFLSVCFLTNTELYLSVMDVSFPSASLESKYKYININ